MDDAALSTRSYLHLFSQALNTFWLGSSFLNLSRMPRWHKRHNTIPRGPTLQIHRTRFQNFLRFQDFTRDFKISLEISRFQSLEISRFTRDFKISLRFQDFIEISRFHSRFQDFSRDFRISFEISGFHSRFQDFSKILIEISTPELYSFVSFNASASMNEGNSSCFVFRYGTAVTGV